MNLQEARQGAQIEGTDARLRLRKTVSAVIRFAVGIILALLATVWVTQLVTYYHQQAALNPPLVAPASPPSRPAVAAVEELKTADCPAQVVRLQLRPGEEVAFNPELKCFPGITIDAGEVCLRLADGSCLNEKAGHQKPSDKRPESMFSKDGARVRYILCPDQTARIKNWTCWPASGLLSGLL